MNRKKLLLPLIVLLAALVLAGAAAKPKPYSQSEDWLWLAEETDKPVDLFFVAPTVYGGDENSRNMPLDDQDARTKLLGASNMERGLYEDRCNLFSPYYRQAAMSVFTLPAGEWEPYYETAYEDVRTAFLYYMKNYNDGRPVVLAGFSQGADMALRLLEEFFDEAAYQDKLVAAYIIGAAVTQETLDEYPHLRMAECAYDLGCIVAFECEAESVTSSAVVPGKTLGINPLNWMTDSTPAEAEENLGACFTDYEGEIKEEIPALCGGYLDPERGTLKVTGVTPEQYPAKLDILEPGCYHIYDYQFFFRNIQKNVAARVEQYTTLAYLKENYATVSVKADKTAPEAAPYLALASNVTPEMLSAEYWTAKIKTPDAVQMTPEEIASYNKLCEDELYSRYCAADSPRSLTADELRSVLNWMGAPDYDCYHNGQLVTGDYWNTLLARRNADSLGETNALRYGICVTRGALRILPTDDVLSASPEFTFYDEMQNSTTLYNEPVIILHDSTDGEWMYVVTRYCAGWIRRENVAVCLTYEQWVSAQSFESFLVVTGDKLRLEYDPQDAGSSELELSMGVRLELIPAAQFPKTNEGRYGADCYTVKLPYRDGNGLYAFNYAFVPFSQDVHVGYLDFTPANVLSLAFECDGCRYGWGGMYNARDCSQMVMELYRCFGFVLPRNDSGQAAMPCRTLRLSGMSTEGKYELLESVPAGSILRFPGHIMMYLGEVDGLHYVISALGSMSPAGTTAGAVNTYESVMVNDLSVTRRNTNTWIDSLTQVKVLWENGK